MSQLTSRERMQRTIELQDSDRIPCCLMSFTIQRKRVNEDLYALVDAELEMGLDSMLFIPTAPRSRRLEHPDLRGLPVRFRPEVTTREWQEIAPGGGKILHKEYSTPAGTLTTEVHPSDDWPHGEHIPFVDDYQVPRAVKPLVTGPEDLDALRFLLTPPSEDDRLQYQAEAGKAQEFAAARKVLLAAGWGVGLDMADWLCGMQNLTILSMESPEFVDSLIGLLHDWNLQRMELLLSAPVDLFIRRAWYEGCDFVTPAFFRRHVLPRLQREVAMAHRCGAKFGYICSSGTVPMMNQYLEAGIDVLIGVDPVQGTYTDLPRMKQEIGHRICLWGGVSGAVTVEMGTENEVRSAVREAIAALGPSGFILCPVDNLTVDEPRTWENLEAFIDEWRRHRDSQP